MIESIESLTHLMFLLCLSCLMTAIEEIPGSVLSHWLLFMTKNLEHSFNHYYELMFKLEVT